MKKRTKKNIKMAWTVFGRMIAATVMCGIVYLSLYVIFAAVFSQPVGYRILETDDSGNAVVVGEHLFTADEDPQAEPSLEEGQTFSVMKEMSPAGRRTMNVVSTAMMLFILASFSYDKLWKLGSHDDNMVQCGRKKRDPLRGVKIGLLANSVADALFVLLVLAKCGWISSGYLSLYRLFNLPFLPYINAVMGTAATAISVPSLLAVAVTLLFVPAVCGLAYHLGYKQFSIHEHLTYAKKKETPDQPEEI